MQDPVDWTSGEGQQRQQWLMRVAGVPEEYRDAEIDRCRVAEEVRAYAATIDVRFARGEGALIFGPTGTGKSSTAALVVQAAVRKRLDVRWTYVPDLCDLMLDSRRRQEVRRMQTGPDLIVWDDFGVRPFSDFEIGLLDQIVENRYRRRKPMIITTNLEPKDLDHAVFRRMKDRWRQRNEAWLINGASMRRFGG